MTDIREVLRDMRTPLAIEAADQIDALVKALANIIAANKDFREGMPSDWEGDLLQDACDAGNFLLLRLVGGARDPHAD